MHPALWQLVWFDFRGSFRSLLNVKRNWRQAVLLAMMLFFVGLFIFSRTQNLGGAASARFGPAMPFWALIYLLATWLTASADRGLVMRPAEIHFIAGGPFRDRDIITLNLLRLFFRAVVSASVLSLVALAYVESYLSALLGMWMLIVVSLLVGMIASLSARKAHSKWVIRTRRLFSIVAIVLLLMLIAQSMQVVNAAGEAPRVSMVAAAAQDTPVGRAILPPLAWMFAPLNADRFVPDALGLLPSRMAVLGCLVASVYALGGRYLEASTRRTDLSIAKRQNALRSGVAGNPGGGRWVKRLTLPRFGRWGGVGSVAWMQMVHSIRILPRFLLFTCAIVGVILVVPLMVDRQRIAGWGAMGWMAGLTAYADFLLLLQLPVGFLGPTAQRETLKMLPIPSWRIVLGQLAGPLIPVAVLHLVVAVLFLVLVPGERWRTVQTGLALIPAALVLIANVNLLGAWNIIRPRALQQRDALAAGRAMASVWIFFLTLTPAMVIATSSAFLAGFLFRPVEGAALTGASLGLLISSVFYVYLLARSFHRWQPGSAEGGKEEAELDR